MTKLTRLLWLTLLASLFTLPVYSESGEEILASFMIDGDTDRAIEAFQSAVEQKPTDALAHAGLTMLASSRDVEYDALDHCIQAMIHGRTKPETIQFLFQAVSLQDSLEDIEQLLGGIETLFAKDDLSHAFRWSLDYYKAFLLKKSGRYDEAKAAFAKNHFVTSFWYCGPFDNAEKGGHSRVFGPEENLDLTVRYPGRNREIGWRPMPVNPYDGFIDLGAIIAPPYESSTYLATSITATEDTPCKLAFGHAGAIKAWLNGKLLVDMPRYHNAKPDQIVLDVDLIKGPNTLLIKVSSSEHGKYGLFTRLVPKSGTPDNLTFPFPRSQSKTLPNLTVHTPTDPGEAPDAIVHPVPIQQLKAISQSPNADPFRLLFYVMLLVNWDILDEHDQSALAMLKDLSKRFDKNPLLQRLLGTLEKDRNLKQLALKKSLELDPDNIRTFTQLLKHYRSSPYATKGFDLITEWKKERLLPIKAKIEQAHLLNRSGLNEAAIDHLRAIKDDLPIKEKKTLHRWTAQRMLDNERKESVKALLKEAPDDMGLVRELQDLSFKYDDDHVYWSTLIDWEHDIAPYSTAGFLSWANNAQGHKDFNGSTDILGCVLQYSPDHFEANRLYAIALNNMGRPEEAIQKLNDALKVNPSNAWCLDYAEFLKPGEETYAAPYLREWSDIEIPDTLDVSNANFVTLLNQRIVKVHQNGNSSETVKQAFKILTDMGVRYQQVKWIQYAEGSETVRVLRARVWKPNGTFYDAPTPHHRSASTESDAAQRLYGDVRVAVLQFQALEKGSVLELEYEKESQGKNIYADYFGDQFIIGDAYFEPSVISNYVLITPKARNFYTKYIEPHYPESIDASLVKIPLEPSITDSGNERIYQWAFASLPKIPTEPLMPPAMEILPYLNVSTFKTWDDMSQWYWNLAKDQVTAGPVVKAKTAEIILAYSKKHGFANISDLSTWDKVRAVNEFVNTGVRYLGLEFGIHGYKPHKVDEICNAQYGDCKDKAVLAVAMLGELGIEANQVIIRTIDRGDISYELPMIHLFNHSIYYLPDVDGKEYWVDGTATFYDATELPYQNAGANTLIIKPGGGHEFRRAPYSKPEDNGVVYTIELTLDTEGNGKGYRTANYRGLINPLIRRTYENTAKAKEMIDRVLASRYPGSSASEIELSDLKDYSTSERLYYELQIPQFGVKDGNRMMLPLSLFKELFSQQYAHLSTREYDVALRYPQTKTKLFTIRLPEGYTEVQLPEDKALDNEFGRYSRSIKQDENVLTIKEEIVFSPVRVPKGKYQAFREFCRLVDLYQKEKASVQLN